jgi:hypothetical protein
VVEVPCCSLLRYLFTIKNICDIGDNKVSNSSEQISAGYHITLNKFLLLGLIRLIPLEKFPLGTRPICANVRSVSDPLKISHGVPNPSACTAGGENLAFSSLILNSFLFKISEKKISPVWPLVGSPVTY